VQHLLAQAHALSALPAASQRVLTGREFFPALISAPFHHGLVVVFVAAASLATVAAFASLLRGGRLVPPEPGARQVAEAAVKSPRRLPVSGSGRSRSSRLMATSASSPAPRVTRGQPRQGAAGVGIEALGNRQPVNSSP
jgi:hypothetical protein